MDRQQPKQMTSQQQPALAAVLAALQAWLPAAVGSGALPAPLVALGPLAAALGLVGALEALQLAKVSKR
jgi:hypothetical protein